MGEETGGGLGEIFKKVQRKVESKFSSMTEEAKMAEEEKKAVFENVAAFISADLQIPKAEFRSGNRTNTIDLQKEKPGTIFRVTWSPAGGMSNETSYASEVHSWLVVGRDKENESHMYEIFQKSTDRVPQQGGKLKLPIDDVNIYKLKRQVQEFNVDDSLQTLFGMPEEYGKVVKVDRMWGGTPEPKKNPENASIPTPTRTLSPVPEGAKL